MTQETYYYPDHAEEIAQKLYDSLLDMYIHSMGRDKLTDIHYRRVIKRAKEVLKEAESMDFITAPGDDYERNG